MRSLLVASVAACAALALAGVLGSADAQSPTSSAPPRTITVNGSGSRDLSPGTTRAQQDAAYGSALNDALDAARAKASAIAQKTGLALGQINNITEQTDVYAGFCGYSVGAAVPLKRSAGAPGAYPAPPAKPAKPHRRRHARKAQSDNTKCQLGASVTVTYAIG
jgi:uncharacterized protein YggE